MVLPSGVPSVTLVPLLAITDIKERGTPNDLVTEAGSIGGGKSRC